MSDSITRIPGGFILYPRCFLEMLEEAPLLDHALWTWLNCRAGRTVVVGQLEPGQLLTSIPRMQYALRHHVGNAVRIPNKVGIWRALERFRNRHMLQTQRLSRGLLITICDYAVYQDPDRYGPEDNRTSAPQVASRAL